MASVRTMNAIHQPLAVTVSVAAQLLGFKDTKSVYTLIRRGKIRACKSGRIFLISYKSLEDYVEFLGGNVWLPSGAITVLGGMKFLNSGIPPPDRGGETL